MICLALFLGMVISPSGAAEGQITFAPVEVTVMPGAQYILAAPFDGDISRAPIVGNLHNPAPPLPDDPAQLETLRSEWDRTGDPDAVAIFKYPEQVLAQLERVRRRAFQIDKVLANYGQRGIEPAVTNVPWAHETGSIRAAKFAAVSIVKGEEDWLRDKRRAAMIARRDAIILDDLENLPDDLQPLASKISDAANGVTLTPIVWLDVIESAAIFNLREQLGLNSTTHFISVNASGSDDIEPNNPLMLMYYGNPVSGFTLDKDYSDRRRRDLEIAGGGKLPSPLVFKVRRPSDNDQVGERSLARLNQYWSAVISQDLFSADDIIFLQTLSKFNYTPEKPWRELAQTLVDNLSSANATVTRWRRLDAVLKTHSFGTSDDTASFKDEVHKIEPRMPDQEYGALYRGLINARNMGAGTDKRPQSLNASVFYLAIKVGGPGMRT
jgi:hypothetical protein